MRTMILEICLHYPGLPDVRTMDLDEIEFFYDGIRPRLIAESAPRE
jgi:hypothetical protein